MPSTINVTSYLSGVPAGISDQQLSSLLTDDEYFTGVGLTNQAIQQVADIVNNAAGAGAVAGEIRTFNNATGVPPIGWARVNQPPGPLQWADQRMVVMPLRGAAPNAFNSTQVANHVKAFASDGGKMYFMDYGSSGAKPLRALNLATFAWEVLAPMPYSLPMGTLVQQGAALYSMCAFANNMHNAFYRYNIAADTWTALPSRPGSNVTYAALLPLPDGNLLACGGSTASSPSAAGLPRAVHKFDVAAGTWNTRADSPLGFNSVRVGTDGAGRYLIYAPVSTDGTTLVSTGTLITYDYSTESWGTETLPAGYTGVLSVGGAPGGKVLVTTTTMPAAASRGLLYDFSKAPGSRWTPYDIGDSDALAVAATQPSGTCIPAWAGQYALGNLQNGLAWIAMSGGEPVSWQRNFIAYKTA